MKQIALITMIALFAKFANAQKPGTALTELGLKGKVKEVIEYTYRGGENIDSLGTPEKIIMSFDESGRQVDETDYDKNGQLEAKFLFTYMEVRTIVKSQYDSDGNLQFKYIFKYDVMGNQVEFGTYSDAKPWLNKIEYIVTYKYDGQGKMIEENTNGNLANVKNKTLKKYNSNNQVIESDDYLPNGGQSDKTLYQYDALGNQVKNETYKISGQLVQEQSISYNDLDGSGNWQIETFELKMYNQDQGNSVYKHITKRHIKYF